MTTNTEQSRFLIRIYYRGGMGEWCKSRTRTILSKEMGLAQIDGLELGHGWMAQLVECIGRKDIDVVKTVRR